MGPMTAPAHTPEQSTELAGLHPIHPPTDQDTEPTPEPTPEPISEPIAGPISEPIAGPISLHPVPADTTHAETHESVDDPGVDDPGVEVPGDARELVRDAWRDSAAAGATAQHPAQMTPGSTSCEHRGHDTASRAGWP